LSVFFDIPVKEFFNRNVPLREILKNKTPELEERLCEAASFNEQVSIVETFFLKLLEKNDRLYSFERIENSIQSINKFKGNVSIDYLASCACLSRKQFERIFSRHIGASPKQFLRTIRFQNAVATKAVNIATNLTELTYACGYYDQSHMINDFQKLSGMTPQQYFKDYEPYSDYFQNN